MKRIQYHKYGGPETMRLEEFEAGSPQRGQVKVKVKFAAINPIDWRLRKGELKMITGKSFPRAMGSDFAGTVVSVGEGVTRCKPGDAVFGLARLKESGALGEVVVTTENFVARKPDAVSFEAASCLGTPGVTAWNGIVEKGRVKSGHRVFINGCVGAVGAAAVQIARMHGATVAGSCSGESVQYAKELGVYPIFDYRSTDLAAIGEHYDIVYDAAGTLPVTVGLNLLSPDGVYLDIVPTPMKFLRALFNRKLKPIICTPKPLIMDELSSAAASGKLGLRLGKTVTLDRAIGFIASLENGQKINGKGLVEV